MTALDSLEPARIMVGFSSLGAWREGGKMVTGRDERPPALHSIGRYGWVWSGMSGCGLVTTLTGM